MRVLNNMRLEKKTENENTECLTNLKSTEFEIRLDQETIDKMSPKLKELLYFNEHIFSASKTLIDNIIALNKDHYNKHGFQSLLLKDKKCAVLKDDFLFLLKKYRLYQRTYSNNNKDESFEIMATDTFETFKNFLKKIFTTIEKISMKCNNQQQFAYLSESQREKINQNEKICLEFKKYANVLKYQFAELKDFDGLNELLKAESEVFLFYKIVNTEYVFSSTHSSDMVTTESSRKIEENSKEDEKRKKNIKEEDIKKEPELYFKENNDNNPKKSHFQYDFSEITPDQHIGIDSFETVSANSNQSQKDVIKYSKGIVLTASIIPVIAVLLIVYIIYVIYKYVYRSNKKKQNEKIQYYPLDDKPVFLKPLQNLKTIN